MAKTKESQQRRQLEYQHFNLIKCKITKDGVEVHHHENFENPIDQKTSGEYQPHPDLIAEFNRLRLYMATRLGLLQGWDYSREHLKSDETMLKQIIMMHDEVLERMKPSGIQFVGEGETSGVLITGSILVPKGGSTGLTVPKITFGKTVLGYEDDVQEICEDIKKEVYAYRFQSKKHQLDIETEAKKKEEPELFIEPKKGKKEPANVK